MSNIIDFNAYKRKKLEKETKNSSLLVNRTNGIIKGRSDLKDPVLIYQQEFQKILLLAAIAQAIKEAQQKNQPEK